MAIVISQQDKKRSEAAIARCKSEHPTVRTITATHYEVTSSADKSTRYTVTWSGKGADMVADCTCRAGQKGQVCKHVVATAGLMKAAVRAKAVEKAAQLAQDEADLFGNLPVVNRMKEEE
jgi:uncharacterized Zn finger protein